MKLTFRPAVALFSVILAGTTLTNTALADTYIKGTQVSYNKDINIAERTNDSYIFIDEANDTENKNYISFACEEGSPIFYLNSSQPLTNKKQYDDDKTPDITVRMDTDRPVKMYTVGAETDDKPDYNSLALDDKFDAQMFRIFQNAKDKVVLSVTRYDKKTINFVFYPKGLNEGFKAVNNCKQM